MPSRLPNDIPDDFVVAELPENVVISTVAGYVVVDEENCVSVVSVVPCFNVVNWFSAVVTDSEIMVVWVSLAGLVTSQLVSKEFNVAEICKACWFSKFSVEITNDKMVTSDVMVFNVPRDDIALRI